MFRGDILKVKFYCSMIICSLSINVVSTGLGEDEENGGLELSAQ